MISNYLFIEVRLWTRLLLEQFFFSGKLFMYKHNITVKTQLLNVVCSVLTKCCCVSALTKKKCKTMQNKLYEKNLQEVNTTKNDSWNIMLKARSYTDNTRI